MAPTSAFTNNSHQAKGFLTVNMVDSSLNRSFCLSRKHLPIMWLQLQFFVLLIKCIWWSEVHQLPPLLLNFPHLFNAWFEIWKTKTVFHFCPLVLFRTVTYWPLTSLPITPGGVNMGLAVSGERCLRLRGSAPQRASPTSPSWAASWITSTSRLHTAAHRSLWLWVHVKHTRAPHMHEHETSSHYMLNLGNNQDFLPFLRATTTIILSIGIFLLFRILNKKLFRYFVENRPLQLLSGYSNTGRAVIVPLCAALFEHTRNSQPASMYICTHSCRTDAPAVGPGPGPSLQLSRHLSSDMSATHISTQCYSATHTLTGITKSLALFFFVNSCRRWCLNTA